MSVSYLPPQQKGRPAPTPAQIQKVKKRKDDDRII